MQEEGNCHLGTSEPVMAKLKQVNMGRCWQNLCKYHKRSRKKSFLLGILLLFVTYYSYQNLTLPVRFLFLNENINKQCIIPDLDPFDKSIMRYIWSPDPIQCDVAPDIVFVDQDGLVKYNFSAFEYYGSNRYNCSYMVLTRPKDNDYFVYFKEEVFFEPPFQIPSDFFRLHCYEPSQNKVIYDRLLESIYEVSTPKDEENMHSTKYSVFMFGIDSTSRLSAIRKLPKTYKYLTEELKAFVFKGYMKVADNTFPNLVPILTGKRPWTNDLPYEDGKQYNLKPFPFLWQNFSRSNYVTFFAEDYPDLATFNTEANGFDHQPTDHYMRPWMLGLKKISFASEVLKSALLPLEYKNINIKKTSSLCYGSKPIFQHVINYYKRFVTVYKSKQRFGFSWLTQICHEFINYLELGDQAFYELFKFLKDEGHLSNAFLIFFSDHGSRIDDIRNTFVGRIEERMPLLSIVPPEVFESRFIDVTVNLFQNTERLVSNFDLHETLSDILHQNFENVKYHNKGQRGISLFRQIPKDRSCADASIPEHFCACYISKNITPTDPLVQEAGRFAVMHLNKLLKRYDHICEVLSLKKINEAEIISLGLSAKGEEEMRWTIYKFFSKPEAEKHKRFLIIFETFPGNAIFEATVNYFVDSGWEITDDISRTNKYGNTSICVPEKPLRRYCYCKIQPSMLMS